MKVVFLFFSSIILIVSLINSSSAFGIPDCHQQRDLDILWPCHDDKTKYYQCIDIHEHELMPCGIGTWFDFNAQSCKRPSEWKPFMTSTKHSTIVETDPVTEIEPQKRTTRKPNIETKPVSEKSTTPTPPIVTRKTTKHRVPPIIKTKKPTRKPRKTPSTPVPTAPTEESDENNRPLTRRTNIIPTRRPPPPTKKPPPTRKPKTPTEEPVPEPETEKEKGKVTKRVQKKKIVPTRAKRS